MDERSDTGTSDSDAEATAAYEKWDTDWLFRPFRAAFWGLIISCAAGLAWMEGKWSGLFRWWAGGLALLVALGVLCLFYDIPQRRLSRFSRWFLMAGIAAPFVLAIAWVICR